MNDGNVKCAIHGEHGNLYLGECWYCVQEGRTIPVTTPQDAPPEEEE